MDEQQQSYLMTYEEWVAADFPRPEAVASLPEDTACVDGAGTVHYSGVTWSGTMTAAEARQRLDFRVDPC
ncbi:MAG: hypothetical protein B7X41_12155 [Microbacterium sp. 14-71-5]|nr:MAG: hypothetical protein B7X41_12155 [Microbacterium sp. 14-71-5]